MKKHLILAAMAMTALFCACSNDDSTPLNEETVPVSFTIGGIDSRATTNTDYTTLFDNNDLIGISATNLTPAMNNVLYTVTVANNTTSIATATGDYAYGAENAVFNAYYPYSASFNNTFSVQADQTNGIGASDFLTATATGSKENATVTLNFSHRLVLVEVNLTGVSNVSSVKLKNAKTEVTYAASTDGTTEPVVNTSDNSTKSDIIMNPVTASSKYWAIIPAQEIATGNLFEVTTSDGKTYLYTTTSASTFTAKKLVKYSLTLAEEAVLAQYNPVTIVAWDTQDQAISGNLEKYKLDFTATINENLSITESLSNRKNLPITESWGAYTGTSATFENGAIKFIGLDTQASSWYNNTLYYYAGKDIVVKPGSSYKISITAKAEAEATDGCKVRIAICQKEQEDLFEETNSETKINDDIHYGTKTGTYNTVNYETFTSSGKTKHIEFYPAIVAESSGATPTTTTKTTNGDVIIAITPINVQTGNETNNNTTIYNKILYITDIKIVED